MITKDVYNKFQPNWYDERHVETIIKPIQFSVKQRLGKIKHPKLIAELFHNMDTAAYMIQSLK